MYFNVICIDDSDRPNEIPLTKWVKKGEIYTVTKIVFLNMQPGMVGFKLAELNIDEYFPYQYFAQNRFAIVILEEKHDWVEELLDNILEEAMEEERNGTLGKD